MRTALFLLTILGWATPGLAQSPLVSPRQYLSGDTALASSMGDQQAPAISSGGGGFLLAWSDSRAVLRGGDDAIESSYDIWCQRLDWQGAPLDPTPTRIAVSADRDTVPRVTWNGSAWLVSWVVQPPTASNTYSRVRAVRVAANGTLIDSQPLTLFSGTIMWHAAASDGQGWVAVARTQSGGVRARLVSSAPTNPVGPAVTLTTDPAFSGDIASAQGSYLLAWSWLGATGTVDVLGRRFDASLNALDPTPIVIAASALRDDTPILASNGSEYLASWSDFDTYSFSGALYCRRISTAGVVHAQQALTGSFVGGWTASGMAWDGFQWFVAFGGQYMARVSASGQVLDLGGFLVRPYGGIARRGMCAAGGNTGGVRAAWSAETSTTPLTGNSRYELLSSHITSPSSLGSDSYPAAGAPSQAVPALAAHSAGRAVLFRSESAGQARLLFASLDAQGAPLDPQPVQVSSAADIRAPALAWDGARYVAAWIHFDPSALGSSIRARRIASDGTLLDPTDLVLGSAAPGVAPSVDAVGQAGEFLVAGIRPADLALWRIRGADGALLSGPTVVTSGSVRRVSLCVTPFGYAVGWHKWLAFGLNGEIGGALVSPQGLVSTPFLAIGGQDRFFNSVGVASSGNELLFAWDEGLDYEVDRRIDAQRFDLAGLPLDAAPFPVARAASAEQFFPDLTWDGTHYVCAYQELSSALPKSGLESDVRAARISSAGVVLDVQGFELEGEALSEGQPVVLGLGGGSSIAASAVFRPGAAFAAYRVATRTLVDGCPLPSTYCTAKVNSQQCLPAIAISGAPSASGAGASVVSGTNVLNNTNGLLLYGYRSEAAPFAGGFLCVALPRRRTPLQNSGSAGSTNPCDGQFTFDLNAYIASGADPLLQIPGQFFACQYWSRDPADPFSASLTNAVRGQVCW